MTIQRAGQALLWLERLNKSGTSLKMPPAIAYRSFIAPSLRKFMADISKCWRIYKGPQLIGIAQIKWHDDSVGIQGGNFIPTPSYREIQTIFARFASASTPEQFETYYAQRDELQLSIRDETDAPRQGIVHILDLTEIAPEMPLEVEIYPVHEPLHNSRSNP